MNFNKISRYIQHVTCFNTLLFIYIIVFIIKKYKIKLFVLISKFEM